MPAKEMTVKEVAKQLGLSDTHVRHLARIKKLKSRKEKTPGGYRFLFDKKSVNKYVCKQPGGGRPKLPRWICYSDNLELLGIIVAVNSRKARERATDKWVDRIGKIKRVG